MHRQESYSMDLNTLHNSMIDDYSARWLSHATAIAINIVGGFMFEITFSRSVMFSSAMLSRVLQVASS